MGRRVSLLSLLIPLFLLLSFSCVSPYLPDFDYASELAASPPYRSGLDEGFAAFSYEPPDSPALLALREEFGLDAIAGTGDSLSRALALMHWLEAETEQDGGAPMPKPKTASRMIKASRDEGAKLNCLATATCLAECLLSLGIKARTLTLYSRKPSNDCHVVAIAWIPELSKWVYLDPSYDTAILDPADPSLPLSPLEIRERLASRSGLAVSEGAGWNGGDFDLDYLHYLSKNFYGFYSPSESAVAWEDRLSRTRVHLTPIGVALRWSPATLHRGTHSAESFFAEP